MQVAAYLLDLGRVSWIAKPSTASLAVLGFTHD